LKWKKVTLKEASDKGGKKGRKKREKLSFLLPLYLEEGKKAPLPGSSPGTTGEGGGSKNYWGGEKGLPPS